MKPRFTMNALPWIIAGVGVGIAAYFVFNQPGPKYATGDDDIEDAARDTAFWGSKQRVSGSGTGLLGKFKESIGRARGADQLVSDGVFDQVAGATKRTAGKAAQAVGETIHDLNR